MNEENIKKLQKSIDAELAKFLDAKIRIAGQKGMPEKFVEALENIKEFVLRGGKRLRPILLYLGFTMSRGKSDEKGIFSTCLAIEFLHVYFLIHDDVIDQDDMRHGGPSMHFKYEMDYREKYGDKDLKHFGISNAIDIGDIVSSWGYEIIANSSFEDKDKLRAIRQLSLIDEETSAGQILDGFLEIGEEADEKLVYEVQKYKTAKYTVAGPLQLGAMLAGAGEAELDFIEKFSVPLGVAYQIRDDVLGIFGDEKQTGKAVGADMREGKKTLLISYVLEKADENGRKFILEKLGDKNLDEADMDKIKGIMKDSGALAYSERKIDEFAEEFLKNLKSDPDNFSIKYYELENLADYLLKRRS